MTRTWERDLMGSREGVVEARAQGVRWRGNDGMCGGGEDRIECRS